MSNSEKMPANPDNQDAITGANLKVFIGPKAYEILDVLAEGHKNNCPPYNEATLPQKYKPDDLQPGGEYYGSKQHAMYFWNVCSYMAGRIKSELAFKTITNIFNEAPELFDCNNLVETDPSVIFETLKRHRLGRQALVANNWIENAQKLSEKYDGDPRNIFKGVSSYQECVDRISNRKGKGFKGFREKMTSMILYYLMDDKLISDVKFPVPVDFHALRVALATEMIITEPKNCYKHSGIIEDTLRDLLQDYLRDREVHPIDITDAVWLLSSNLCSKNIGNNSATTKNGKGSRVRVDFIEMDPNNFTHAKSWYRSCGKCILENYCKYYIPAGPYYTKGAILPRDKKHRNFIKQMDIFDLMDD